MRKNKKVTLKLSPAILAMSAMLGRQEPLVQRLSEGGKVVLSFAFAANQRFALTFSKGLLIGASMQLVKDKEPSTFALSLLQDRMLADSKDLSGDLDRHGLLEVDVVDAEGFDLEVPLADIYNGHDRTFAAILKILLVDCTSGEQNLFGFIAENRSRLVNDFKHSAAA